MLRPNGMKSPFTSKREKHDNRNTHKLRKRIILSTLPTGERCMYDTCFAILPPTMFPQGPE